VASNISSSILLWNDVSTAINNQAPNITINLTGWSGVSNGIWTNGIKLVAADYNAHQVLIWNTWPVVNNQGPDITIGITNSPGCTNSNMNTPRGIASDGTRLFVADGGNNRVLVYNSWPTANGQAADAVLGQADFISCIALSTAVNTMNAPSDVTYDGSHLVVTDTGNHRLLVFP